jgi:hypothetical protein
MMPGRPVRGSSCLSAPRGCDAIGASPLATCHLISPLSRSIALMRPYGGLTSGSPYSRLCTDRRLRRPPTPRAAGGSLRSTRCPVVRTSPPGGGTDQRHDRASWIGRRACAFPDREPPGQLVAGACVAMASVAIRPSALLTTGSVKSGRFYARPASARRLGAPV